MEHITSRKQRILLEPEAASSKSLETGPDGVLRPEDGTTDLRAVVVGATRGTPSTWDTLTGTGFWGIGKDG